MTCPNCQQGTRSRVEHHVTAFTLATMGLLYIFAWPLCWLPLILPDLKTTEHYCRNCNFCLVKKGYPWVRKVSVAGLPEHCVVEVSLWQRVHVYVYSRGRRVWNKLYFDGQQYTPSLECDEFSLQSKILTPRRLHELGIASEWSFDMVTMLSDKGGA